MKTKLGIIIDEKHIEFLLETPVQSLDLSGDSRWRSVKFSNFMFRCVLRRRIFTLPEQINS